MTLRPFLCDDLLSSAMSNSRWSSLPEAIIAAASVGTTSVRSLTLRIWNGTRSRPGARSTPFTRPARSTTTRSPVISVSRLSPASTPAFPATGPAA